MINSVSKLLLLKLLFINMTLFGQESKNQEFEMYWLDPAYSEPKRNVIVNNQEIERLTSNNSNSYNDFFNFGIDFKSPANVKSVKYTVTRNPNALKVENALYNPPRSVSKFEDYFDRVDWPDYNETNKSKTIGMNLTLCKNEVSLEITYLNGETKTVGFVVNYVRDRLGRPQDLNTINNSYAVADEPGAGSVASNQKATVIAKRTDWYVNGEIAEAETVIRPNIKLEMNKNKDIYVILSIDPTVHTEFEMDSQKKTFPKSSTLEPAEKTPWGIRKIYVKLQGEDSELRIRQYLGECEDVFRAQGLGSPFYPTHEMYCTFDKDNSELRGVEQIFADLISGKKEKEINTQLDEYEKLSSRIGQINNLMMKDPMQASKYTDELLELNKKLLPLSQKLQQNAKYMNESQARRMNQIAQQLVPKGY